MADSVCRSERRTCADTMVIGYYEDTPIFVEAMFMKQASFDLPIPAVAGSPGPMPTKFRADYDAAARSYRFVLSGFTPGS